MTDAAVLAAVPTNTSSRVLGLQAANVVGVIDQTDENTIMKRAVSLE